MSNYFCGVDLSVSSTGLAVVEYIGDSQFKLISKKTIAPNRASKGFDRKVDSFEIFKFALESFSEFKDVRFFIFENYSFGSPGRITDLAELAGLYKYHITKTIKKPFDLIAPQSVKKIVTGSGRADKVLVRESLSKFIVNFEDIKFENYDESDALAVAVAYGLQMEEVRKKDEQEKNRESSSGDK